MAPSFTFLQGYTSTSITGQEREATYPAAPSTTSSNYPVRRLNTNGNYSFFFNVPFDFGNLISLYIVASAASGGAVGASKNIDLFSSYGALGQSNITKTGTNTTTIYTIPAVGEFFSIPLTSVFPNLVAGDFCGVRVNQVGVGGNVDYYAVVIRYQTI